MRWFITGFIPRILDNYRNFVCVCLLIAKFTFCTATICHLWKEGNMRIRRDLQEPRFLFLVCHLQASHDSCNAQNETGMRMILFGA